MSLININLRTIGEAADEPEVIPSGEIDDETSSDVVPQTTDEEAVISVPNTGEFSKEQSLQFSPVLVGGIVIAVIVAITFVVRHFRTKRMVFSRNKGFGIGVKRNGMFVGLAVLLSALSMFGIAQSGATRTDVTNAAPSNSIAISASDVNLDITRDYGEPVYGFSGSEVTVVDGTANGYTLGVYASDVDIVSTEGDAGKISNITASNSALEPNTWGISLRTPGGLDSEVWNPVPVAQDDALILKSTNSATEANDTTNVYYGAYVDSDLPDGTYSGVTINYFAIANVVVPDTFTLSFNANNGTRAPGKQTCTAGETPEYCAVNIPSATPTRSGHTFLGWAETASATTPRYQPGDAVGLTGNKTIYAVWRQNTVTRTLSFDAGGGSGAPGAQSCVARGTATSCSVTISSTRPTRSGYDFLGWASAAGAVAAEYDGGDKLTLDGDKILHAVWKKIQTTTTLTLTYHANGGSGAPNAQTCSTLTSSCAVTISSTKPTRTNYTFVGWATTASATTASYNPGGSITLSKNTTIYAVWKNNYAIRFNGNGSTGGTMSNLTMVYGTARKLTTNAFSRTGYTFSGWNTKADGTGTAYSNGQSVNNLTTTAGKVIDLYAQWKGRSGKIHYISTGGSNAFLIESNGHYGLIDSANPLYPANSSDPTTCINSVTCVSNSKYTVQHVVEYLRKVGVRTLDFVVASHSHSDHIGGMPKIAKEGFVNSSTKYYYRRYAGTKEDTTTDWHNLDFYNRSVNAMRSAGAQLIEITSKEPTFDLGDFSFRLLNTEPAAGSELDGGVCKGENLNSVVILATIGSKKILFASDMETSDEAKIASKVGAVDILQMGHHGLRTSSSLSYFKVIKPKTVIIPNSEMTTASKQWESIAYGHKVFNTSFYLTGLTSEAIIVNFSNNNYTISDYNSSTTATKLKITSEVSNKGSWIKADCGGGNVTWMHIKSDNTVSKGWEQLKYGSDTSWYYFDESTAGMVAGEWREILYQGKTEWFYLDTSGRMATGTKWIEGEEFSFNSNGVCISGRGCPHP